MKLKTNHSVKQTLEPKCNNAYLIFMLQFSRSIVPNLEKCSFNISLLFRSGGMSVTIIVADPDDLVFAAISKIPDLLRNKKITNTLLLQ